MYLFIDTETTGKPTRRGAQHSELSVWPRIVSVSWAFWGSTAELSCPSYEIVRPDGFKIPDDATRVHGISTEKALREGRPLREVLATLQIQIEIHRPTMLVAHNVDFDRPTLLAEMLRVSLSQTVEHLPTYCTMASSTAYCAIPGKYGDYKWPSLDELHRELFNEPHSGAHDARADLMACARCFFQMQRLGIRPTASTSSRYRPPASALRADAKGLVHCRSDKGMRLASPFPPW